MKLNKTLGRVATTLVAATMLASVSAVPAFAEAPTAITSINIGKTVTTDGKSFAPNATYTFKVEDGDAGKYTYKEGSGAATATEQTVMGGIGGLTVNPTTSSAPTGDTPAASYTLSNATIQITADKFANATPGIYHYVVSEESGTVEGMSYDTSKYDLYVYVLNGASGINDHYVAYVVAVEQVKDGLDMKPGTEKATEMSFVNDYDSGNNLLHDVTITKCVQGNMGDKVNDTFDFNVTVKGDDGEVFYIEYKTAESETAYQKTKVKSGDTVQIQDLKDTGVIKIYGLDSDDKYQVVEQANDKGYEVYIDTEYTGGADDVYTNLGDGDKKADTGEVTMGTADQNIAFYNVKQGNVATGIVMDIAPYALLVVVAAAGCFVFLRKRRED